ncbi:SpoVR family protein [Halalkalibacillus halophilus]|uniref:SpoVR family protein n=1 Tax=Halalkalibacillus halophilus TaxID=392827 RepID=UPI00048054F8|nr:SpoVR family protein [Halalkalibacillus halophilus]
MGKDSLQELMDQASEVGLNPVPFRVKELSDQELITIQARGYEAKWIPATSKTPSSDIVMELFEPRPYPIAYLRKNLRKEQKKWILAHVIGHADFLRHHELLQQTTKAFFTIRKKADHQFFNIHQYIPFREIRDFLLHIRAIISFSHVNSEMEIENEVLSFLMKEGFINEAWKREIILYCMEEAGFFAKIHCTSLLNEGYATIIQKKLLELVGRRDAYLYIKEDIKLHEQKKQGINIYRLGSKLWEQVPKSKFTTVLSKYDNDLFLKTYYTSSLHLKESISFFQEGPGVNSKYEDVKKLLRSHFSVIKKPVILVDHALTKQSGYLTLRTSIPLQSTKILKFKSHLEKILAQKVYMKSIYWD